MKGARYKSECLEQVTGFESRERLNFVPEFKTRQRQSCFSRGYAAFPVVAIVGKQCTLPPGEIHPRVVYRREIWARCDNLKNPEVQNI